MTPRRLSSEQVAARLDGFLFRVQWAQNLRDLAVRYRAAALLLEAELHELTAEKIEMELAS